jgi:uncharacterized iron-regulated membrane protein
MKKIRKIIFWIHLGVGLVAGAILLVMAVSGCLLSFERQLIVMADGFDLTPKSRTLDVKTLVGERSPTGMIFNSDPTQPVALQLSRTQTEFINPYTGESMGPGNTGVRGFFKTVLTLHRSLGQDGALKSAGKAVIGAASLSLFFLLISGLILWCPRKWTLLSLRTMTQFRWKLKGRARDWNWHTALGFWSALPLLVLVISGLVITYPWANALLFSLAGESVPKTQRAEPGARSIPNLTGIDAALALIKAENPQWQSIQVNFAAGPITTFVVADSHRGRPDLRKTLRVDTASNTLLKTERFSDQSPGKQARTWLRWIHTGEAGGLWGQALAGLTAAACVVLIVTGFSLSWRRFTKKKTA